MVDLSSPHELAAISTPRDAARLRVSCDCAATSVWCRWRYLKV